MSRTKYITKRGKHYTLCLRDDTLKISDGEFSIYKIMRSRALFDSYDFLENCIREHNELKQITPKPEQMNTKEITITLPEGYEIDKEKSTLEKIVFRALPDKGLPRTWEELDGIDGYYVDTNSIVDQLPFSSCPRQRNRNLWPTREEAEASIALAQLCQLRDRYNGGRKINFDEVSSKHNIIIYKGKPLPESCVSWHESCVLSFLTAELRDKFLENFRDLIEKAKPLL